MSLLPNLNPYISGYIKLAESGSNALVELVAQKSQASRLAVVTKIIELLEALPKFSSSLDLPSSPSITLDRGILDFFKSFGWRYVEASRDSSKPFPTRLVFEAYGVVPNTVDFVSAEASQRMSTFTTKLVRSYVDVFNQAVSEMNILEPHTVEFPFKLTDWHCTMLRRLYAKLEFKDHYNTVTIRYKFST
jgi:hypothetical protein